ncbi:branched-chain amino acid ABC transporter permease [Chloroflexota bacterium]
MTFASVIQSIIVGLSLGSSYVLMALGLTLMFGILGVVNISHGVLYMLGAFGVYYLYIVLGLNFYLAMLATIATLGLAGFLMERGFYRPVRGEFAPVIVLTVGLAILIESGGYLILGTQAKGVEHPLVGEMIILGLPLANYRIFTIVIAAILVAGMYYLINQTTIGRKMRAVEEDKVAAALHGINPNRINAFVFSLGIGLAAAAGALIAPLYSIQPSMGTMPLAKAFMVIVLGGMGSVPGAILGALAIGLADSLLGVAVGPEPAYIIAWLVIIVVLVIRPRGLLGAY